MSSLASTLAVIQQQLIRYVCSAYLIFGITGCCLNIILFTRQQFRTISCCIYFMMASVAMLVALLLGIVPYIYTLDHENPYTTIVAFCKMRTYILQSSAMMYRWFLTAACIDRCILLSNNGRLRNFAKVRMAYRVIAAIIIVWLIVPLQILVLFNLKNGACAVVYGVVASLYFSSYTIITGSFLPVSIMIICAILIRRNLLRKRQRRRQLTNTEGSNREQMEYRRDQQVFSMLLFQVIAYFITQTPWTLLYFYTAMTIYISDKSADRIAIERFIGFVADMIVFLLPTSSFYLYTLASHTFRREFIELISSPVRLGRRNIISALPNDTPTRINPEPVNILA